MSKKIQYYRDAGATNYYLVSPDMVICVKLLDNKVSMEKYNDLTVNQLATYTTLFNIRYDDWKKALERYNQFAMTTLRETLEAQMEYG
jgi:hypothetical protein